MPRTHPTRPNTRAKAMATTNTRGQLTIEALAEPLVERRRASPPILDGRRHPIRITREGAPHAS